jgi:transposase
MMVLPPQHTRVYLALGSTDMRKAIDGLSILVEGALFLNPFSGHLFVFCNRRRSTVKILYWQRNGFCLFQKRLEKERFRWPKTPEQVMEIGLRELSFLLEGLDFTALRPHRELQYSTVM